MTHPTHHSDAPDPPWDAARVLSVLLGESTDGERAALDRAVAQHEPTAALVRRLSDTLAALQNAGAAAAVMHTSAEQRAKLAAIARPQAAGWISALSDRVRETVAVLIRDTLRDPAQAMGFRGPPSERVLSYQCDQGTVDVRVAPDPANLGRFWIHGRFAGAAQPQTVRVADAEAPVGRDGYFEIEVGEGAHEVVFAGPDFSVVLPGVPVGQE